MMAVTERFEDLRSAAEATNWRGRSGRYYALNPLPVEHFALDADGLYLLARGSDVLWVGTEADVVGDAARRAAFRTALRVANAAYRIEPPEGDIDRLTMAWDLEGAEPLNPLRLA